MIIIDTCFWMHIQELNEEIGLDLRPIIRCLNWGYTKALEAEYKNYRIQNFAPIELGSIITLSEKLIEEIRNKYPTIKELDLSDQTIFVAALHTQGIVLSDDGELLMECLGAKLKAFRLPPFLLLLVEQGKMKKKEVRQALHFWRSHHLYKQSEIKKWQVYLDKIQ